MRHSLIFLLTIALLCTAARSADLPTAPDGWSPVSPRDSIKPAFAYDPTGGRNGKPAFIIRTDAREGLDGFWKCTQPVIGGKPYRFQTFFLTNNVPIPRRSVVVRVLWTDAKGKKCASDRPVVTGHLFRWKPTVEAEFPTIKATTPDGWTEISDTWTAPATATTATIELHLQWATSAAVRFSDVQLAACSPLPKRLVRLAAVHYYPREGKTPEDKCRLFAPFIEQAAKQKADLVVLGECIASVGLNNPPDYSAEPIPGPSTDYFGILAKQHNLYIVVGLIEKADHLIYNVAALIGPDGKLAGKYRKVCLPREEIEKGRYPGHEYPVFDTRFGKLGMMVCYDGFFPEVARELTNRGAEVIAWPVWGCNPLLARARACENQIYLVSSTYSGPENNWMLTAIFDPTGQTLAEAKQWGEVVIAEVDLNHHTQWHSLGDFKAELPRHRPIVEGR